MLRSRFFMSVIPVIIIGLGWGCQHQEAAVAKDEKVPAETEEFKDGISETPETPTKIAIPIPSREEISQIKPVPYRLRIGDNLEISILDYPEMTRDVVILPDGSISYLLIGEVPARDKTLGELRHDISLALQRFERERMAKLKREPYRLQVGDMLEVSVLGEPEMKKDVTVLPGGTISYLLVGEVDAAGKIISEVRTEITRSLTDYFISPQVSVLAQKIVSLKPSRNLAMAKVSVIIAQRQEKFASYASILGALEKPGKYEIGGDERILDLITSAEGLLFINDEMGGRTVANLKAAYLSRDGKKMDVDFDRLLRLGDMEYNLQLEPDDFIYIPDAESSAIFVLGEVTLPRIIPYNRDMSLVEAISRSGGFTDAAQRSRVLVIRGSEGKNFEIDVQRLLLGKEEKNLMLESGDVIFIPEQGLSEYARYARYLTDIADLIISGYQVRETIRFPRLNRHDQ